VAESITLIRCTRCGFIAGQAGYVDPFGEWRNSGCEDSGEHGPTANLTVVPASAPPPPPPASEPRRLEQPVPFPKGSRPMPYEVIWGRGDERYSITSYSRKAAETVFYTERSDGNEPILFLGGLVVLDASDEARAAA
jgi:hypothetical protein